MLTGTFDEAETLFRIARSHSTFLTASQKVFDALTVEERHLLVAAGRDAEVAQWKLGKELIRREHHDMAAQGVSVATQLPADVLAALRMAAEPHIQSWANALGVEGTTTLKEYRRSIGRN